MPVVERQEMVDRLVALNGGYPGLAEFYASFDLPALKRALDNAEDVSHRVRPNERLADVWREDGSVLVEETIPAAAE